MKHHLKIESLDRHYEMEVRMMKVDKAELLSVENPHYRKLINDHPHLKGVSVTERDTKSQLPVHMVLGSGEYARIKNHQTRVVPHVPRSRIRPQGDASHSNQPIGL